MNKLLCILVFLFVLFNLSLCQYETCIDYDNFSGEFFCYKDFFGFHTIEFDLSFFPENNQFEIFIDECIFYGEFYFEDDQTLLLVDGEPSEGCSGLIISQFPFLLDEVVLEEVEFYDECSFGAIDFTGSQLVCERVSYYYDHNNGSDENHFNFLDTLNISAGDTESILIANYILEDIFEYTLDIRIDNPDLEIYEVNIAHYSNGEQWNINDQTMYEQLIGSTNQSYDIRGDYHIPYYTSGVILIEITCNNHFFSCDFDVELDIYYDYLIN
eukprot:TRINITY_DN15037_c0_g1_i1.p1 TRINITY_DN15037_c0_g1~~TRINITY_DN15037_c0_g1_i1.p1  ORF type:complete len:270 (-),score=50.94 TRINITY_DN15037_c0_g1_i1:179-988(-)